MTIHNQDFYEFNYSYLHAARELARSNPQQAVVRFGLSPEVVDALVDAAVEDLRRVANSSILLFQPRGNQRKLLELIKRKGTGVSHVAYTVSSLRDKGE